MYGGFSFFYFFAKVQKFIKKNVPLHLILKYKDYDRSKQ